MAKNKPNRPLNQSFQKGCARLRYTTFDNISLVKRVSPKATRPPLRRSPRTSSRNGIRQFWLSQPVTSGGDGNFHVGIMINPNEPKEIAEAERLNERLVHRALSFDGPCPASTASAAANSTS